MRLVKYVDVNNVVVLQIYNGLNYTPYLTLVVSNGTYAIAKPVVLKPPQNNHNTCNGLENATVA